MNPEEYQKLSEIDQRHWFYAGKREIVRSWIQRFKPLSRGNLLVDAGAGTGTFAAEMTSLCRVIAVDDHEESLIIARQKLGPDQVQRGTCLDLPFADNTADVVTALDVIEHVPDDRKAIAEFSRVLKAGGLLVITVPALPALWSDWDVALHHYRRYTKTTLQAAAAAGEFEVLHLSYINVAVLPIVYAVRKWRGLKQRLGGKVLSRSEDSIPPEFANRVLRRIFVGLACQSAISFPAGVGLLAVLRRKGPAA